MASRNIPGSFRFDAFRFDGVRGILFDAQEAELRLRPKSFLLLRHLLDNPGRVLGREELLDALWPGIAVTDDSLTQCVGDLRHAFGSRAAHVLRTVPKRGYMLIAEVRREEAPRPQQPVPDIAPSQDIAALRRETIRIHRFDVPDGDPACTLLADGMVTDLIARLTYLEGLRVLPAADALPGEGYHLRGTVRALGGQLRVTVRLEEARRGTALWAEQLDQPRDGLPELPAAVLTTLTIHLCQMVDRHCLAVARQKPVAMLSARELHLIGRDHHHRGTEVDVQVAKDMFARAIVTDPDYAHAYAWQAYTVHRAVTHGWGGAEERAAQDEALRLARRAVQLDPTSPLCLSRLAFALALHRHWDEAVAVTRAALVSDRPAFTAARDICCEVLTQAGHPEEAAAIARGTLLLDPFCPPTTRAILGRALLLAGGGQEAWQALQWCTSRLPDYAPFFDTLVVAEAERGHWPEAAAARGELLRLRPGWAPGNHGGFWNFRRPADLGRFEAAYRRVSELAGGAAGPEAAHPVQLPGPPASEAPVSTGTAGARPVQAIPGHPALSAVRHDSVAVMSFRALDGRTTSREFAAALKAELCAELAICPELEVQAGGNGRTDYRIDGEVRAAGDGLLATIRLEDARDDKVVWAERLQHLQGEPGNPPLPVMSALAKRLAMQMDRASLHRARGQPEAALTSRQLCLLGRDVHQRGTEADTQAAQRLFARARAVDPGNAAAHALEAFSEIRGVTHGWAVDSAATRMRALVLARRAMEIEPASPLSACALAFALTLTDAWDEAVELVRAALQTERPVDSGTRISCSEILTAAGHSDEAAEILRQCLTTDPHCPPRAHAALGRCLLLAGNPEAAFAALHRTLVKVPDYVPGLRSLVVAAAEIGRLDEALTALNAVRQLTPKWPSNAGTQNWYLRRPEDIGRFDRALALVESHGSANRETVVYLRGLAS